VSSGGAVKHGAQSQTSSDSTGGFCCIPNELLTIHGPVIGPHGIAVYSSLALHANWQTGICWPSKKTIGLETGLSPRQVQRVIGILESQKIIRVERLEGESNRYRLLVRATICLRPETNGPTGGDYLSPGGETNGHGGRDCQSPKRKPGNETKRTITPLNPPKGGTKRKRSRRDPLSELEELQEDEWCDEESRPPARARR
jgi:hypothetical protein